MIIINDKYITTQKFYKLTSDIFAGRLNQANLVYKIDIPDIADFAKKKYFDDKLKNLNKKVTSNKPRQIEINIKIDDLEKKFKVT